MMTEPATERITVFFDGVCNLCNSTVSCLVNRDRKRLFRYAALQGETYNRLLGERPELAKVDSIVGLREAADGSREVLTHSDGPLFLARRLGGGWRLMGALRFLPRFLRDGGYRLVARLRYRLFGKKETCRLPPPDERELFLR